MELGEENEDTHLEEGLGLGILLINLTLLPNRLTPPLSKSTLYLVSISKLFVSQKEGGG